MSLAVESLAVERHCAYSSPESEQMHGATSLLEVRAGRLGRGLVSLGIEPGDEVAVLCCDQHRLDGLVALTAVERLGATAVVPSAWTNTGIGRIAQAYPKAVLACEEGVTAWREVRGTGVLIGEAANVLWWKGLECRHSHTESFAAGETA